MYACIDELELFRQTVVELRILVKVLKQRGYEKVGAQGFSFGGYCCSLLACFEKKLDFAIPMASIGHFIFFLFNLLTLKLTKNFIYNIK